MPRWSVSTGLAVGPAGDRSRRPYLTVAVLVLTAGLNALQFVHPATLELLQRTPAGLHGQWWRTLTSLLVQDGGLAGTATNLTALAFVGAIAERVVTRPRWLLQYLGAGLVAELVAYSWQPVGGGNSIAVCGLAGAVVVALWRHHPHLPPVTPTVLLLWLAALVLTAGGPAVFAAAALAVVGLALPPFSRSVGRRTGGAVAAATIVVAAGLALARNIHGAALLVGLLLGLPWRPGHRPRVPRVASLRS